MYDLRKGRCGLIWTEYKLVGNKNCKHSAEWKETDIFKNRYIVDRASQSGLAEKNASFLIEYLLFLT